LTVKSLLISLVLAILLLLRAITHSDASSVGSVTEQTGPTEIKRSQGTISSALTSAVEMNDTITTANSRAGITFKDDTKVQITEHSKLVIDTFIYDGNKRTGKLGIKMALGTIKYTSGQIAKNNPQMVKVVTPSATIGVRGTDFSSTVDEIGRSTIILLPSCPVGWKNIETDCVVGVISVTTDMGTIFLTRAFEAVAVTTNITNPRSNILDLTLDQINNLIIVTPPKTVVSKNTDEQIKDNNYLDVDFLGKDFLKYTELENNYLDKYDPLSKNALNNDFLFNYFYVTGNQMLTNELDEFGKLLPRYDPMTGLKFFIENDHVTLYRQLINNYAEIRVSITESTVVNITQDNLYVKQIVNNTGTTTITIKQGN